MIRPIKVLVPAICAFCLCLLTSAWAIQPEVPGEAVIKIVHGASLQNILDSHGISVKDSIPTQRIYLVSFHNGRRVQGLITALSKNPNVELAVPNFVYELPEVQQASIGFPDQDAPVFNTGISPPNFYQQPGVYTTGIDSANAYASGSGVVVAVIDNGIDFAHPLCSVSTVQSGWDFVDNDGDATAVPGDMYGHGTFVTGLVLLTAPDCEIMPLRAFNGDGVGTEFTVASALYYAADHGANIANLSFGTSTYSSVIVSAIDYAGAAGVFMAAPAGNSGSQTVYYPGGLANVMAVSSFDTTEVLASFSSYGSHIDISAPGVDLYSAYAGEYEWAVWSGTSFSVPLVCGTAALLLQLDSTLTPALIETHLENTARTSLLWGNITPPSVYYGYGALDALEAVLMLGLGDLTGDGSSDISDLAYLVRMLTSRTAMVSATSAGELDMLRRGDLNCDGRLDMTDLEILVDRLMTVGSPFYRCGSSP